MVNKTRRLFAWMNRKSAFFFIIVLAVLVNALLLTVRFTITGGYEGIFLLRGDRGAVFELKDDLYLGEGKRYLIGFDFVHIKELLYTEFKAERTKEPYLYFEWNDKQGDGYIRNYLPGGRQLLTCFGRFLDETGGTPEGLFVGGGLPASVIDDNAVKMNETGMAYYDGKRWFHIWCNVNELLFDSAGQPLLPSRWKYLGSRVLHYNEDDVVLESSHEAMINDMPLRIERHAYFRAGDPYFVLSIKITNRGARPATYIYLYGDEPWLGNYGTSGGNVGWSAEGLYNFASPVNTNKSTYAGLFDYGNDAIGEGHNFTLTANFIEWFGKVEPYVYFSNGPYDADSSLSGNKRIPFAGDERFIGVQWGPRTLQPGTSEIYTMAIGMAEVNGFPVKPRVNLKYYP